MSRERVERIAEKWAEFFPVERVEQSPPVEEPEPVVNKGNYIPSAGDSPGELSDDQKKALSNSGKTNHELLAEMLAAQNVAFQWYGPQK
ncbi:hypothetical protein [Mycolicibacterium conceptionense]|uniref:hypothetical protein n=1 Tax=Mycolicibacterium conceptionense TaxID=451644 RepID=UPI0032047B3E